jgi:hypothetical protein
MDLISYRGVEFLKLSIDLFILVELIRLIKYFNNKIKKNLRKNNARLDEEAKKREIMVRDICNPINIGTIRNESSNLCVYDESLHNRRVLLAHFEQNNP